MSLHIINRHIIVRVRTFWVTFWRYHRKSYAENSLHNFLYGRHGEWQSLCYCGFSTNMTEGNGAITENFGETIECHSELKDPHQNRLPLGDRSQTYAGRRPAVLSKPHLKRSKTLTRWGRPKDMECSLKSCCLEMGTDHTRNSPQRGLLSFLGIYVGGGGGAKSRIVQLVHLIHQIRAIR